MRLTIVPDTVTSNSTISRLSVDGRFECYVLEPPNPIPAGTYSIRILPSLKFGRPMPHLLAVPGHEAIEIHWGNTAKDTRNCLLTGQTKGPDFVGKSHLAFEALFAKLSAATSPTIEISRGVIMEPITPVSNTAAVSTTIVGGAVARVLIEIAKQKGWFDLSSNSADLVMISGGVLGYLSSHLNALGGWVARMGK